MPVGCATLMLRSLAREGTPINVIRDDLGHTSLAVTDRYLRDVAPQAVIDTLRVRRWDGA